MNDFQLPWDWKGFTDVHHIAVYYLVKPRGGELSAPFQFEGQYSLGAVWVSAEDVKLNIASSLILRAFEWLETMSLGIGPHCYKEWKVYK